MPSPELRSTDEMLDLVTRQATERIRRRDRRRRRVAPAAAVGVVLVAVAAALAVRPGGDDTAHGPASGGGVATDAGRIGPPTTLDREPLTEPEGWTPMGTSPLSGRSGAVTAWTGTELLVWRGNGAMSDAGGGEPARTDSARYNPATDRWRPMADAPMPAAGTIFTASQYASAWTGEELIVWGGPGPDAAAYDPAKDSWRPLDPGPLGKRVQFASAWTGEELMVYGGYPSFDEGEPSDLHDGALYDPATDSWRTIPPSTAGNVDPEAVWDGHEVVVFGGATLDEPAHPEDRRIALALDVDALTWRRLAPGLLDEVVSPAVWTGTSIVAFGSIGAGAAGGGEPQPTRPGAVSYDPALDRWTEIGVPPGLSTDRLVAPTMVWSGKEVLLFGAPFVGIDDPGPLPGAAFDPSTGTWRTLPESGLSARSGMSAAWTGSELVLWGGAAFTGFTSEPLADGARYRPGPGR